MGMYLNPGNSNFRIAANSEIFVDKSEMIRYINTLINTNQRYICVSRPRRFGKTMAADMLCAYYDCSIDSRELFCNKRVADATGWDKFLDAFNVIRLVMTDFIKAGRSVEDSITVMTKRILTELAEIYPQVSYDPDDLVYSTEKFYQAAGRQFVIIIDEWDAVFRIRKSDHDGQQLFLDFLRGWLKDRSYVALAYMTGILPIKKYGQHSALNMFDEYSMTMPMQMAPYSGFTNEEVEDLCNRYGRNYEQIRTWYNGYEVYDIIPPEAGVGTNAATQEQQTYSLYSPLSVVKAVSTGIIQNYWNQTESYQALADYISMNMDGLKDAIILMMQGERIKVDISGYQNDMTTFKNRDDVLALLIHLGYLGYDGRSDEVFIPNREIMDVFRTSTSGNEWAALSAILDESRRLLEATWSCDADTVARMIETSHDRADNKTYNDESALKYAISNAYYAAREFYTELLELDSGKGYVDIAYIPSPKYPEKPALVIELKYDQSADTAINQIIKQNYPDRLRHYKGNILLVGINYDKEARNGSNNFKHHTCTILKA